MDWVGYSLLTFFLGFTIGKVLNFFGRAMK